jgi:hypothetical protein
MKFRTPTFTLLALAMLALPVSAGASTDGGLAAAVEARIARALPALASRTGGLACLEVLTSADEVEGDLAGFLRRTPAWYRRRFAAAGLAACGAHCYLGEGARDSAAALERLD